MLVCKCSELVVVYFPVSSSFISDEVVYFGKKCDWCTMCEVSSVAEIHTDDSVSWFHHSCVCCDIGRSTRKCLNVCMVCSKDSFSPIDGELFYGVSILLSSIVSSSRKSFTIFVCKMARLCFEDCCRLIIF